ncbi:flagellar biosynthetic protein FliR, partial [Buchnera aphidicola]|nr:flagellar biosynthetic protein FliR [Buchnera aphidicola]
NIFMLLFFLSCDMHLYLISILVDSFQKIPIDIKIFNANIFLMLLEFSSVIFIKSMIFILPIMIVLLLINIVMSILHRLSPQISIFSIGFSINLIIGIFLLSFFIPIMFPSFEGLFYKIT